MKYLITAYIEMEMTSIVEASTEAEAIYEAYRDHENTYKPYPPPKYEWSPAEAVNPPKFMVELIEDDDEDELPDEFDNEAPTFEDD